MADFALYDAGGIVRGVTMTPEAILEGTEYQDHFWVKMENEEIVELEFDPEFTEKKKEEYRDVAETHKRMQ